MTCEHVKTALAKLYQCEETQYGVRILTSCLYPSFETVGVFIVKVGDGFHVHDGGEARGIAWQHGREHRLADRQLSREAKRFGLMYENGRLVARVQSADWLGSAILSVANAASIGSYKAVEKIVRAAEAGLQEKIYETLRRHVPEKRLAKEYDFVGASGKTHRFDFAVTAESNFLTLIDAVAPHHVSISAKYVAFSDMKERFNTNRIAVHDNHIKSEDKALLQQVAEVLPYPALEPLVPKMMAHA